MGTQADSGLALVAGVIGEPARAAMLGALLGGRSMPAGELARCAGVSPSTASAHLARLVDAGLLVRRRAGRHRYYVLAGADVAAALEALARVAPPRTATTAGPTSSGRNGRGRPDDAASLRFARICYDHLAGFLGVIVTDAFLEREIIVRAGPEAYELTGAGTAWLGSLGIDAAALHRQRRALVRPCLDWTERRDHLAGAVGAAVAAAFLERGWLMRLDGSRAVRLTARGREGLYRSLGLEVHRPGS